MGLFGLFGGNDINKGVEECKATPGAVLLDVRAGDEYRQGHIPGSINIPLNELPKSLSRIPDKNAPLFVYCLGGGRATRAAGFLKKVGYTNIHDIGGINSYKGKVEV